MRFRRSGSRNDNAGIWFALTYIAFRVNNIPFRNEPWYVAARFVYLLNGLTSNVVSGGRAEVVMLNSRNAKR